jgi:hypothetical protein
MLRDKPVMGMLILACVAAIVAVVAVSLKSSPPPGNLPPSVPTTISEIPIKQPAPKFQGIGVNRVEAPVVQSTTAPTVAATQETKVSAGPDESTKLRWAAVEFIYKSFTRVDKTKIGKFYSHKSRDEFSVREGGQLEPGVLVQSLSAEVAIVRLGDSTYELKCTGNPKYAFLNKGPSTEAPTDEEHRLGHERYMLQHGNRAIALAEKAGRPPARPWSPKTADQMKAEMEKYLATTGKEAEKRQNEGYEWRQPDPRTLTREQMEANRRKHLETVGMDPNTKPIYRDEKRWEPRIEKLEIETEKLNK